MKILGFSLMIWVMFLVFFMLGTKYPNALAGVPVLNKI